MPSACFDGNHQFSVKTHWKHAEGMSLRYDSVFDSWDWGGDLVNWGGVGVFLGGGLLCFALYFVSLCLQTTNDDFNIH